MITGLAPQSGIAPEEVEPATAACVCYVINNDYILPALVSALQARKHLPAAAGDVVILCLDRPDALGRMAQYVAEADGVELVFVDPDALDGLHVMFGRFLLTKLLTKPYRRIVYIDGDTQVQGSLEPLLKAQIPDGCFLAARDPTVLFAQLSPRWRRRVIAEHESMGYQGPLMDYSNSGVLVVDGDSWSRLSQVCLEIAQHRSHDFRHPDQDILNVAVGEQCRLISNRWNFPGFLIGSPAEETSQPRIYHFLSNPRPWRESAPPWGERWTRPYAELLKHNPQLSVLSPTRSALSGARYWLQQHLKMALEYRALGRLAEPAPQLAI